MSARSLTKYFPTGDEKLKYFKYGKKQRTYKILTRQGTPIGVIDSKDTDDKRGEFFWMKPMVNLNPKLKRAIEEICNDYLNA